MPRTIHKTTLALHAGPQTLMLSKSAIPLSAREQHGNITLWYETDSDSSDFCDWEFFVVLTGGEIPDRAIAYVGTALLAGGHFVAHVYQGLQHAL